MKGPLMDLECEAEHAAARQEPAPGTYAPGGRWERVLRALQRRGPLKASQVYAATRGADHSSRVERAKVWRALVGLESLGFVEADQARFSITWRGEHALRDGDAV